MNSNNVQSEIPFRVSKHIPSVGAFRSVLRKQNFADRKRNPDSYLPKIHKPGLSNQTNCNQSENEES